MKPYYQDNHNTLYRQDFRKNDLPDGSDQMVTTSPPYWGLRKYSGEQELIWGEPSSDEPCRHQWVEDSVSMNYIQGNPEFARPHREKKNFTAQRGFCSLCGAWKGAYGLEPTPEMYVQHTIEILREIRRVLRKDGVVFWNIGDSYGSGKGTCFNPGGGKGSFSGHGDRKDAGAYPLDRGNVSMLKASGLKPKDLCLIPFRVAIEAQEDGWWVRSIIIWSKPNPMPESVTDRPTESHEYIIMLAKSARYYWDQDAVRREYTEPLNRWGGPEFRDSSHKYIELGGHDGEQKYGATSMFRKGRPVRPNPSGANIRSVWEFPTQPYPEAHFAVFPEKLPEICIKAATPEVGCCSKCGSPWERITEKIPQNVRSHKLTKGKVKDAVDGNNPDMAVGGGFSRTGVQFEWEVKTLGWQPTCKCNADKVPSIVLDPFAGAGTTLWVAKKLNRRAVGYEISEEYCQLAVERMRQQVMEL